MFVGRKICKHVNSQQKSQQHIKEIWQTDPKIYMEENNQDTLWKEETGGEVSYQDTRTYFKELQ